MQAVILAGGLGTRFRPLTLNTPKSMIPVEGRPYLEYQLRYLKSYNITEILLCTGYLGECIQDYFSDGQSMGLRIKYSYEKNPLGTGGALKNAMDQLDDCFFLIYGDSFLPINYYSLEECFSKAEKSLLMVLYDNENDTTVTNNVSLNEDGMVTQYKKDSANSKLKYVDAGVMVLKRDIMKLITPEQVVSLEEEIFPDLIDRQECAGFITQERFYDIGTPNRLEHFELYLKRHNQGTKVESNIQNT